jgi:transcriptional regulator of arginine metabolism
MNIEEILGTVAGENCIFACLKEGVSGAEFIKILRKKIPDLDV